MTETKHTPGPWRVDGEHPVTGYGDVDAAIVSERLNIATVYGGRELQPNLERLPSYPEARANARLIAAAPDLLEALQELLKAADFIGSGVVDWSKWIDDAGNQARAAIAKATGAGQ